MPKTIAAEFETRRDAEMAVEAARLKSDAVGEPALTRKIKGAVQIADKDAKKIRSSFSTFAGEAAAL